MKQKLFYVAYTTYLKSILNLRHIYNTPFRPNAAPGQSSSSSSSWNANANAGGIEAALDGLADIDGIDGVDGDELDGDAIDGEVVGAVSDFIIGYVFVFLHIAFIRSIFIFNSPDSSIIFLFLR